MPVAVLAIIQARMSSTRLPGKVLLPIAGQPMILRQIARVRRATLVDHLVVATSLHSSDDVLADACSKAELALFRGSLDDVLSRFHAAWRQAGSPDHVVRLTADCPLADWTVIDACICLHLRSGADYTSNTQERRFPKGLDVEVIRGDALAKAHMAARDLYDREHVTPYFYKNPGAFRLQQLTEGRDRGRWRWTVDTPADFAMVQAVYEALLPEHPSFTSDQVATYLAGHPTVAALNGALG